MGHASIHIRGGISCNSGNLRLCSIRSRLPLDSEIPLIGRVILPGQSCAGGVTTVKAVLATALGLEPLLKAIAFYRRAAR